VAVAERDAAASAWRGVGRRSRAPPPSATPSSGSPPCAASASARSNRAVATASYAALSPPADRARRERRVDNVAVFERDVRRAAVAAERAREHLRRGRRRVRGRGGGAIVITPPRTGVTVARAARLLGASVARSARAT
jgi:hypothetical protein